VSVSSVRTEGNRRCVVEVGVGLVPGFQSIFLLLPLVVVVLLFYFTKWAAFKTPFSNASTLRPFRMGDLRTLLFPRASVLGGCDSTSVCGLGLARPVRNELEFSGGESFPTPPFDMW